MDSTCRPAVRALIAGRLASMFDFSCLQEAYDHQFWRSRARSILLDVLHTNGLFVYQGPVARYIDILDSGLLTAARTPPVLASSLRFTATARRDLSVHGFTSLGATYSSTVVGELSPDPSLPPVSCVAHIVNVHLQSDNRLWDVVPSRYADVRAEQVRELASFIRTSVEETHQRLATSRVASVVLVCGDLNVDARSDRMAAEWAAVRHALAAVDVCGHVVLTDAGSPLSSPLSSPRSGGVGGPCGGSRAGGASGAVCGDDAVSVLDSPRSPHPSPILGAPDGSSSSLRWELTEAGFICTDVVVPHRHPHEHDGAGGASGDGDREGSSSISLDSYHSLPPSNGDSLGPRPTAVAAAAAGNTAVAGRDPAPVVRAATLGVPGNALCGPDDRDSQQCVDHILISVWRGKGCTAPDAKAVGCGVECGYGVRVRVVESVLISQAHELQSEGCDGHISDHTGIGCRLEFFSANDPL